MMTVYVIAKNYLEVRTVKFVTKIELDDGIYKLTRVVGGETGVEPYSSNDFYIQISILSE